MREAIHEIQAAHTHQNRRGGSVALGQVWSYQTATERIIIAGRGRGERGEVWGSGSSQPLVLGLRRVRNSGRHLGVDAGLHDVVVRLRVSYLF